MDKKEIILKSRYPDVHSRLVLDRDNKYVLLTDSSFLRIMSSSSDNDNYEAIDPSGGPYISVGSTLEGKTVKKITHKEYVVIELE